MKSVKFLALILSAVMILGLFSGCDLIGGNVEGLIAAPRPTDLQEGLNFAIAEYLGDDISFIIPLSGNNRRPVIVLDEAYGKGIKNGLVAVFYKGKSDGAEPVKGHIAVFENHGETEPVTPAMWDLVKIYDCSSDQVDFIEIKDYTEDGQPELLVGWYQSENTKELCSYNLFDDSAEPTFSTTYNEIRAFHGNGKDFIFSIYRERISGKGTAKITANKNGNLETVADCAIFGGYDSVASITYGKIFNAQNAIMVDCKLGNNMVTQIFKWSSRGLENVFYDEEQGVAPSLIRVTDCTCSDIDGDGIYEVPFTIKLPEFKDLPVDSTQMVLTAWSTVNFPSVTGKTVGVMSRDFYCLMLPGQKYYYVIPSEWIGSFTALYSTVDDSCTVYRVDGEQATRLFGIYLLTDDEFEAQEDEECWYRLLDEGNKVYALNTAPAANIYPAFKSSVFDHTRRLKAY